MSDFQKRFDHFNLIKYFVISSAGFFILATIFLGFVFITYQKRLLTDYAVSSSEKSAHQISKHVYTERLISLSENKAYKEQIEKHMFVLYMSYFMGKYCCNCVFTGTAL